MPTKGVGATQKRLKRTIVPPHTFLCCPGLRGSAGTCVVRGVSALGGEHYDHRTRRTAPTRVTAARPAAARRADASRAAQTGARRAVRQPGVPGDGGGVERGVTSRPGVTAAHQRSERRPPPGRAHGVGQDAARIHAVRTARQCAPSTGRSGAGRAHPGRWAPPRRDPPPSR